MSYHSERAHKELELGGFFKNEGLYGDLLGNAVMELMEVLEKQGHSGYSATMTSNVFTRLVAGETLTPLTGEDSEWTPTANGCFQNNRCTRVFKRADGTAYDSRGKIFVIDGVSVQRSDSRVDITFPYTPKTEIVHV